MGALQYIMGAILIIISLILIVVILLQEAHTAGLSGAISGGADSFLGKSKGRTISGKLAKLTKVFAVVFFVLAVAVNVTLHVL